MAGKIIAAIDIGSTKVSAAIAVAEGNSAPRVIGEASYPAEGIKKGEITGIDDAINSIAQALSAAERMAGLTVSSTYVSINGKHIISNNNKGVVATSDNEINVDDVLRAMEQAKTVAIPPAREIIHLIPREFVVDTTGGIKDPVGMTGNRLEVNAHIISATNTALHNLRKCIQTLGLRIDREVFTGWAAAQSVLTPTEKELGVMLLDIGGGTTSITIFDEGAVTYSTSIPFGGANVTRDLAAILRLSLEDAEKVKLNIDRLLNPEDRPTLGRRKADEVAGDSDDKSENKKDIIDVTELDIEGVKTISKKLFMDTVEARMEETFEFVRDNIVQAGFDFKLPAGVILTGGSAELPNLTKLAKKVFGVPARVASPRGLEGLVDGISSPSFAVLQGMILDGVAEDDYFTLRNRPLLPGKKQGGGGNDIVGRIGGFLRNLMP
jgi:cell division protein FtsA